MSELTLTCPNCRKIIKWSKNNPHRPFCSERCQILDLGEWASDNRYIPSDAENDDVTAEDLNSD